MTLATLTDEERDALEADLDDIENNPRMSAEPPRVVFPTTESRCKVCGERLPAGVPRVSRRHYGARTTVRFNFHLACAPYTASQIIPKSDAQMWRWAAGVVASAKDAADVHPLAWETLCCLRNREVPF